MEAVTAPPTPIPRSQEDAMQKIKDISAMPKPGVYRRATGETFAKLNAGFHVKAKLGTDGSVKGGGHGREAGPRGDGRSPVGSLNPPNPRSGLQ